MESGFLVLWYPLPCWLEYKSVGLPESKGGSTDLALTDTEQTQKEAT